MIETHVEGDPGSVTAAATWLRGTLGASTDRAADHQVAARSAARDGWEGDAASAYQSFTRPVVTATDDHVARIGRAATAFDDLSARLQRMQRTMEGIRGRAAAGGLTVSGTVVQPPPSVPASVVVPGSPEDLARQEAIARVELYDELAAEASLARSEYDGWIQSRLPSAAEDAAEETGLDKALGEIGSRVPGFAAGAGAGLTGLALGKVADDYRGRAREFRRRSRVSGNPAVRGQADTPGGRAQLDDWLNRADDLGRWGRILGGPAGVAIDVGFGIREGAQTGDWTRAAITTGTSIAVGAGVALAVVTAPVSVPAAAVVIGGGLLAAGASWTAGYVYDNWDDITGWAGDRVGDVTDWAGEAWDDVTDVVGDTWDAVTPW